MAAPIPQPPIRYVASVIPALIAWSALDADAAAGSEALDSVAPYAALSVGLVGAFLYDEAAAAAGRVPKWYPVLRTPLTFVVLGATCASVYLGREPRTRRAV
jgi:hypothetical protein